MPRYFLHLHNGSGLTPDEEGMELPTLIAAREFAVHSIRDLIAEEAKREQIDLGGCIEITDGAGQVRAVINFAEAVELHLPGREQI